MAGKNAFYAQSGGVTAVINASACGVLETARQHPEHIVRVYAGRNGILGALTEDLMRNQTPRSQHSNTLRVRRLDPAAISSAQSTSTACNTSA
jgi:ATP-dependent phosphofructokinase / diphosphate-dependent phosphofructokinase